MSPHQLRPAYSCPTISTEISTAGIVPLFSSQCVVFLSSGQPSLFCQSSGDSASPVALINKNCQNSNCSDFLARCLNRKAQISGNSRPPMHAIMSNNHQTKQQPCYWHTPRKTSIVRCCRRKKQGSQKATCVRSASLRLALSIQYLSRRINMSVTTFPSHGLSPA